MESEGCNDGTTPQEQQMEAQQPEGNEGQANTAQQPDDNERCDDPIEPQEQVPDDDNGQMHLFSDDESDDIEDESKEDTVQTEQHYSK